MSRSRHKGPFVSYSFHKKVEQLKKKNKPLNSVVLKTFARNTTILPEYVGMKILVHKGNGFVNVFITNEKVGKKLGDFALTRAKTKHNLEKFKSKTMSMGAKKKSPTGKR